MEALPSCDRRSCNSECEPWTLSGCPMSDNEPLTYDRARLCDKDFVSMDAEEPRDGCDRIVSSKRAHYTSSLRLYRQVSPVVQI
jgi:hypothetical protein